MESFRIHGYAGYSKKSTETKILEYCLAFLLILTDTCIPNKRK